MQTVQSVFFFLIFVFFIIIFKYNLFTLKSDFAGFCWCVAFSTQNLLAETKQNKKKKQHIAKLR